MSSRLEPLEVNIGHLKELVADLLTRRGISAEEFDLLGKDDELLAIDPLLDFVYRSLWPVLKSDAEPAA